MPSRGTARILRAAIAAIRPRGHGFDQPIDDDVLAEMQRFFVHLPTPMRLGFPVGLRLLEWGPPVFARRMVRFSDMPAGEAREIRGKVLRDQLGEKLAHAAEADFEAPIRQPAPVERKQPAGGPRKRTGKRSAGQAGHARRRR